MYHLFLDDERMPDHVTWLNLPVLANLDSAGNDQWEIVRSYEDFVQCIAQRGLPTFISFDHDIGFGSDGVERNGLTCAKWLVDYCLDNDATCPPFAVHSKNIEGEKNIAGLLNGFRQFQNKNQNTNRIKP